MHVRTSHVPRFEVEIGAERSLFELFGISYDEFRKLPMREKMRYIRDYARSRLKAGERLWWIENYDDAEDLERALPLEVRMYTSLSKSEKERLRAEAALLCPAIVRTGQDRHKYDDAVLFMITYHGVLCHQARDLFSAGSVAVPGNKERGGKYIVRALKILEKAMINAAAYMEDALFVEYWGESVPPERRIARWLEKADALAKDWVPSQELFCDLDD